MARAISKCPNCREPVSPFAAGCAICGTNLEQARAQLAAKRARRPQLPSVRIGDDGVRIGVAVLAAGRHGRAAMRNLMLVLLGFSLVGVFAYARIWGGVFFGV
jgi:hypothetical protein